MNEPEEKDDGTESESDPPVIRRAVGGPWGRMAEKWVPESLREARVDPGRRGAILLTVVAAVAAVVAAVGVWRDRPETRPVQPVALSPVTTNGSSGPVTGDEASTAVSGARASPAPRAPAATSSGARSVTASSTSSTVYVSVTGFVRKPGVVRLRAGSRVADAIASAGGVNADGDVTGMNLAAVLSDGDSVVVGGGQSRSVAGTVTGTPLGSSRATVTGAATATPDPAAATPVNLNEADQSALEALPGVGPVMAGNILAWRNEHGSFSSVEQLQEVSGIGPARYAQLASLVTV